VLASFALEELNFARKAVSIFGKFTDINAPQAPDLIFSGMETDFMRALDAYC